MPHLPEGVQAKVDAAAARMHTYRVEAVSVSGVRQAVQAAVASHAASADTHQREAVRVRVLRSQLSPAHHPQPAPADTHGREAVQVHAVRQGLPPEGDPGPAHQDPPGRPAVLLPDAELPTALRHRARGQETHRQPHEPARGQDAPRLHGLGGLEAGERDVVQRSDAHDGRQAGTVLPAVLRAHLQSGGQRGPVPDGQPGVQAAERAAGPVTNGQLATRSVHWVTVCRRLRPLDT